MAMQIRFTIRWMLLLMLAIAIAIYSAKLYRDGEPLRTTIRRIEQDNAALRADIQDLEEFLRHERAKEKETT